MQIFRSALNFFRNWTYLSALFLVSFLLAAMIPLAHFAAHDWFGAPEPNYVVDALAIILGFSVSGIPTSLNNLLSGAQNRGKTYRKISAGFLICFALVFSFTLIMYVWAVVNPNHAIFDNTGALMWAVMVVGLASYILEVGVSSDLLEA